jgi:hypothetical protein
MSSPGPGPPYPLPSTQSAGIGQFEIGVSQIGTVIPFSYWSTIISQYANSTVITTLVSYFDAWLDQTQDLNSLYDDIQNVATAQGYGLDVWGRIVGVVRTVNLASPQYFGFFEQGLTVQPFGVGIVGSNVYQFMAGSGPFYNGESTQNSYSMTDSQFRQLIYAKAMFNVTNGSVPAINAILRALFCGPLNLFTEFPTYGIGPFLGSSGSGPIPLGNAYVQDNQNMTISYVFDFPLTALQIATIYQSNILPSPTGVLVYVQQVGTQSVLPIALTARAKGPAVRARAATGGL